MSCGTFCQSERAVVVALGVEAHGHSCPAACGILVPQPGVKPVSLHCKADF